MSALAGLFVIGFVFGPLLWLFVPEWRSKAERHHERLFHGGGLPAPQPRTKEEARRWRADWEARK